MKRFAKIIAAAALVMPLFLGCRSTYIIDLPWDENEIREALYSDQVDEVAVHLDGPARFVESRTHDGTTRALAVQAESAGRSAILERDSVFLYQRQARVLQLPQDEIASLDVVRHTGRDRLRGAAMGLGIGTAAGVVIGLIAVAATTDDEPEGWEGLVEVTEASVIFGSSVLYSLMAGAVIGGVVGTTKTVVYRFHRRANVAVGPQGLSMKINVGL
jgi:hypothetical protein